MFCPCVWLYVLPSADLSDSSTTLTQAFLEADEVLHAGVRGISDIITVRQQQSSGLTWCSSGSGSCSYVAACMLRESGRRPLS